MQSTLDLAWPDRADAALSADLYRIIRAVAELGGAIGYVVPPERTETDAWLDEVLTAVRAGNAALVTVAVDGQVQAAGLWRRSPRAVSTRTAEVQKVMAHPAGRGRGLGRAVVVALIEDARRAGLETLTLGARGNNHGAIQLYEQLGFREWGRQPNVIEVGDERYDDVRMALDLGAAPGVVRRGSPADGPGSSPRRPG